MRPSLFLTEVHAVGSYLTVENTIFKLCIVMVAGCLDYTLYTIHYTTSKIEKQNGI